MTNKYAIYDSTTRRILVIATADKKPELPNVTEIPAEINVQSLGSWSSVAENGDIIVGTPPPIAASSDTAISTSAAVSRLQDLLHDKEELPIAFVPTGETQAVSFPCNAKKQARYALLYGQAQAGLLSSGVVLCDTLGVPHTLSQKDLLTFVSRIVAYTQSCMATYVTLYGKIQEDPTTDISVGWPASGS